MSHMQCGISRKVVSQDGIYIAIRDGDRVPDYARTRLLHMNVTSTNAYPLRAKGEIGSSTTTTLREKGKY